MKATAARQHPKQPAAKHAKVIERPLCDSGTSRTCLPVDCTKRVLVAAGWAGNAPSVTAGISLLGPRPTNTHMCASYVGLRRARYRTMIRLVGRCQFWG